MYINFLLEVFNKNRTADGMVWRDTVYSYDWLLGRVAAWKANLETRALPTESVVSIEADFSPETVAVLLALIDHNCVIVPLTSSVAAKKNEFRETAQVEFMFRIEDNDDIELTPTSVSADHELLARLKRDRRPGLILFSSGSTGKSKGAVHDLVPMLEKFKVPRHSLRAIAFLLFDHIGGLNTLFYTLSNAGCVVTVEDRSPESICATIEKYDVELMPTSPTFINLLLVSKAYQSHDLSSLKTVTYGTEVMPESILKRFHEALPNVRLQQTYGLSEVGILRSKSKASDSLWVKVGGEGFETRVVDGMLEIRASSAMLGYLNAPSPFTEDGWFITGDAVEVDGEYLKILGRKSEVINVGGEKVYPVEVESVIQLMDGVEDVSVCGEPHRIMGQIVKAVIKISTDEDLAEFRGRMRGFCEGRLDKYMIPQKVVLADGPIHGERFKKMRR